jgi:hypothetical protein
MDSVTLPKTKKKKKEAKNRGWLMTNVEYPVSGSRFPNMESMAVQKWKIFGQISIFGSVP